MERIDNKIFIDDKVIDLDDNTSVKELYEEIIRLCREMKQVQEWYSLAIDMKIEREKAK